MPPIEESLLTKGEIENVVIHQENQLPFVHSKYVAAIARTEDNSMTALAIFEYFDRVQKPEQKAIFYFENSPYRSVVLDISAELNNWNPSVVTLVGKKSSFILEDATLLSSYNHPVEFMYLTVDFAHDILDLLNGAIKFKWIELINNTNLVNSMLGIKRIWESMNTWVILLDTIKLESYNVGVYATAMAYHTAKRLTPKS